MYGICILAVKLKKTEFSNEDSLPRILSGNSDCVTFYFPQFTGHPVQLIFDVNVNR